MQEQNEVLEILQQLREELNAPRGMFGKRTDIPYCCDLCDKLTRLLPSALADAEYLKKPHSCRRGESGAALVRVRSGQIGANDG